MNKEEIQKLHLLLILVLRELTKEPYEYNFYEEYFDLNISPLDNLKNKSEHLIAIKVLEKIILKKIGQLEYFEGIS